MAALRAADPVHWVHPGTQTYKCGWAVTRRQLVVKGLLCIWALIWLIVFFSGLICHYPVSLSLCSLSLPSPLLFFLSADRINHQFML